MNVSCAAPGNDEEQPTFSLLAAVRVGMHPLVRAKLTNIFFFIVRERIVVFLQFNKECRLFSLSLTVVGGRIFVLLVERIQKRRLYFFVTNIKRRLVM